mgnify:CR=1 FL=1
MAVSRIDEAGLNVTQYGNRNILYNGKYTVAQRGTSYQFSNTNASVYGTADRWEGRSSQGTTLTQSIQTDAPDGFTESLRYYCDSGGTITQMIRHQQLLEGQDWQHLAYGTADAKDVTLSFWVKSNVTGTYTVSLYVYDANEIYRVPYTINSSGTWEYKTITFAGNTSGNCNSDNTVGIELAWALGAASGYKGAGTDETWESYSATKYATGITADIGATTGNYWQITGVQLEVGDTATPFEHRSYADELAKCLRYYYRWGFQDASPSGTIPIQCYGTSSGGIDVWNNFPTEMRAKPTITVNGTWTTDNVSSFSGRFQNRQGFSTRYNLSSDGNAYVYADSVDDYFEIDAEL